MSDLRSSAGWRRLALAAIVVLAPVALGIAGFAIFNIQSFMRSGWAFWALIGCLFVPYSIAYVADLLRRRESRGLGHVMGDSSPISFAPSTPFTSSTSSTSSAAGETPIPPGVAAARWIWAGLVLFAAYAVFRISWATAAGATFDWSIVVALAGLSCVAAVIPSVVAWQRFSTAVDQVVGKTMAWPLSRTDQFADQVHRRRPGMIIPQDLSLIVAGNDIAVWTTERKPRRVLSMPLDANTTVTSTDVRDRSGSAAIRLERLEDGNVDAFDLIVRRKGIFTYFRADQPIARDVALQIRQHWG